MKSQRKLLSLILSVTTLFCCFGNFFVKAADIDVSGYTYVVDNMTFYKGEEEISSLSGATEVAVDVTRRVAGGASDRLIISTYSDTGEYIGMYSVTHHIDFGKTSNVKVLLNVPEGKTVGEVKAYVWKSFSDMTPLSNSLSSKNNMTIDPRLEYEKEVQTKFSDVSVNDSFADAVSLMAYLGIMNGYEDGTFRPTGNLRIADAARLITYMTKGEVSASILESEDLVSDEIPSSIEKGYINYCVDAGYLTPDENGYVNYNENITTGEFLKLTVNALGYSNLATVSGGWPRGYISVATQYGIADVSNLNYSDPITRSTAAEILYSAINAPIAQVVDYSYDASGALVPKIQIQDGVQSGYYQSMLTQKFNIYKVDCYVVATQKDGLKSGEVNFAIAKTQKYAQDDVCILNAAGRVDNVDSLVEANVARRLLTNVNVGDTAAADYKGTYATVYLKLDENGDWELAQFIPSDKNNTIIFDLSALDTAEYESGAYLVQANWTTIKNSTNPYLKFFVDDATVSTKYMLDTAANVKVYVNGVLVSTGDPVWTYVINGDIGEVELVDTYKTDGKYDTIHVNSYATAMVDSVTTDGKIMFSSDTVGAGSLTLDAEDDTLDFHIYLNDEEITVNDLTENDILTIAYDVTAAAAPKYALANSKFYEIYVSRDVVTGTFSGRNAENYMIKVDGTSYSFIDKATYNAFSSSELLGDSYHFKLDKFGRIYSWEFNYSSINWAIAEKFTISSADDDYTLTIFTDDGTTEQYYFDADKAKVTLADGTVIESLTEGSENALNESVHNLIYADYSSLIKQSIENRVIQYKINSATNKVTQLTFVDYSASTDYATEFKSRTNAIGSVKLGNDTNIIDACYYYDGRLSTATVADLYDGGEYQAYGYGDKVDGAYLFTLITNTSVSPMNYAIAEDFIQSDSVAACAIELYNVGEEVSKQIAFKEESKIITADGTTLYAADYLSADDFSEDIKALIYDDSSDLNDFKNRIISYRIAYDSTGNRIEELKFLPYTNSVTSMTAFDADTNTIEDVVLSADALMIDISDMENNGYCVFTPQSFADGRECKAYAYDETSSGEYPLILITEADEAENVSNLWGIAEKFTISSSDDEYKMTIFTDDGTTEQYYFDSSKANVTLPSGTVINTATQGSSAALEAVVSNLVYTTSSAKQTIENRVIKYTISGITGKIVDLEFLPASCDTLSGTNGRLEFSKSSKTIGDIILSDTTNIIDATKYVSEHTLSVASISDLYDGTSYEAYAYSDTENGAYPFVLITLSNISPTAYAVAESFTTATNIDNCSLSLFDINEGSSYTFPFDAVDSKITYADGSTKYTSDYSSVSNFCQTMYSLANTDVNITDRIISYRLNYDTSCIEELAFLPYSSSTVTDTETTAKFNANTKTIGDISLTDDALILDTSEDEYITYNIVSFVNGTECEAYAYDLTSDEKSPLIIVTAIGSMPTVAANWAIAEKFTKAASDDDYKLTMFTADGTTKAYYFDTNATVTKADGTVLSKDTDATGKKSGDAGFTSALGANGLELAVEALVYSTPTSAKTAIDTRVIQYRVSSSTDKIVDLKFIAQSANTLSSTSSKEEYNARNNTIGAIRLGDTTKIVDATKYPTDNELSIISLAELVDEVYYEAFAYGTKTDGVYPFVLIKSGEAAYNKRTRFAVMTESGYSEELDPETGDIVYSISALYGNVDKLTVSDDVSTTVLNSLVKGEVIFFKTNAAGQVTAIDKLLAWTNGVVPSYDYLARASLVNNNTTYSNLASQIAIEDTFGGNYSADFTTNWNSTSRDAIKVVYGPVIEVTDNDMSFGKVNATGKTNTETDISIFDFSDDIRVYTYDYAQGTNYRFEYQANAISAILSTTLLEAYMEADGITVDWNRDTDYSAAVELGNQDAVTFAFAVIVDDEVQDIFAFLPK